MIATGIMEESISIPYDEQKEFLMAHGEKNPILSYNQTDFVKKYTSQRLPSHYQQTHGNSSAPRNVLGTIPSDVGIPA
jgi:hypothetical protein